MKKLVLVMVFVLLTAVFIAFNYLLWDREDRERELKNLEYANASDKAEISSKSREIDNLEKEINSLGERIAQLEREKEKLLEEKNGIAEQKSISDATLREKINFINIIKQHADMKVISEPLTKWVEALNQGKYDEAYELEYAAVAAGERPVTLAAYTEEMEKTLKKIDIDEVKLDKLRGSGEGEIYLAARLAVKLAEGAGKNNPRFAEGINERYVKIAYSAEKKSFIISSINSY